MNLSEKIKIKIKWLRVQPENVKVRYIWVSAFVVFAIVGLLWVGLFRQYQRKVADDGKSAQLIIEEGKKIKDEIENKIKDIELPAVSPEISPEASPFASPELSPKVSSEIILEVL